MPATDTGQKEPLTRLVVSAFGGEKLGENCRGRHKFLRRWKNRTAQDRLTRPLGKANGASGKGAECPVHCRKNRDLPSGSHPPCQHAAAESGSGQADNAQPRKGDARGLGNRD